MDILISVAVSAIAELAKKLAKRFGKELSKKIIAGIVFLLCVVSAILYSRGIITPDLIQRTVELFLIAIGYYETIYKRLLIPVFNALTAGNNNK